MWLLWHQTFVVNSWQATLITTSQRIVHPMNTQLWNLSPIDSSFAQELLRHGNLFFSFFFQLWLLLNINGSKKALKPEQCLFGKCLPNT
jgi:hypothetical protein